MRVSEHRYDRDIRRINLARRLIRHEVRTQWICAWTDLSAERIRNLYHSYLAANRLRRRRRGPSPTRTWTLVRSPLLHSEASALAGIAQRMEIIPREPLRNAPRILAGLELGERLCKTFELYHEVVPGATFSMEQFILLVFALAEGKELQMDRCDACHGVLIIDRLGATRRRCPQCRRSPEETLGSSSPDGSEPGQGGAANGYQQSLF
jgi:hypothetical protein